jgi:hypothetical protein
MKTRSLLRKSWMALGLITLLAFSLFPHMAATAAESPKLVRLTVINRSDMPMRIQLTGTAFYSLRVEANTTKVFTPQQGNYTYNIQVCGLYTSGSFDLSKNQRLLQPKCAGGDVVNMAQKSAIDLTKEVKLVKVNLLNETGGSVLAILSGPGNYVFSMTRGQEKSYTIGRGDYTVTYYACGVRYTMDFRATANQNLRFKCPK